MFPTEPKQDVPEKPSAEVNRLDEENQKHKRRLSDEFRKSLATVKRAIAEIKQPRKR